MTDGPSNLTPLPRQHTRTRGMQAILDACDVDGKTPRISPPRRGTAARLKTPTNSYALLAWHRMRDVGKWETRQELEAWINKQIINLRVKQWIGHYEAIATKKADDLAMLRQATGELRSPTQEHADNIADALADFTDRFAQRDL